MGWHYWTPTHTSLSRGGQNDGLTGADYGYANGIPPKWDWERVEIIDKLATFNQTDATYA